ncbi:hypothetical protein C8F01DRAFT_269171 [Mycena amicta]|nr:hypothetical protein C8F01DRAFT_269171 [Mycena amicta]
MVLLFLLPLAILDWTILAAARQTFFPPAVPLAVRSPTFNTWLDTRNVVNPMMTFPKFWNDEHIEAWAGYIRIDGVAYRWLGATAEGEPSTWLNTSITPTRTIISFKAGPLELNVTFLSPIEPDDLVRQSFPFSYVYLEGTASDGKAHDVQIYADIGAQWVSNGLRTAINWGKYQTLNTAYLQVQSSSPSSTFEDVAEDSIAFHAVALNQPGLQSIIGSAQSLRAQVSSNVTTTKLTLTSDLFGSSGQVQDPDNKFPVLAHLVDFGSISAFPSNVFWAVGLKRDPVVTFQGAARHGYWLAEYGTIGDAIDAFITDFPAAKARALALDDKILADASAISQEYADLVSLGLRQALAGVEITVSNGSNGGYNTSDVLAFMKDLGNSQRVNPTEIIYASMPALVYLNSSLIGLLLEPLLQFQSSSAYGNPYAAPDLGTSYPAAPGNAAKNATLGVEHSGNMIILALAHARASGDGSILGRYYGLFKSWANFLANNTFDGEQQSADSTQNVLGQTHGNLTNLGVKSIVGIRAMAQISEIVGAAEDAEGYQAIAANLTQTWMSTSVFPSGLAWKYGNASSSGMMYNLFADKLLRLNAFPSSVYEAQQSQLSTSDPFGVPLSSDSNSMTRSDWTLFSAAVVDTTTRDRLISGVHARASLNTTNGTFANLYDAQTGAGIVQGSSPNGFATPAQGAMLSLLALSVPNKTITVPALTATSASTPKAPPKTRNVGAIVAGVLGGLAAVVVVGLAVALVIRNVARRRQDRNLTLPRPASLDPSPRNLPFSRTGKRRRFSHTQSSPRDTSQLLPAVASELPTPWVRSVLADLRREMAELRASQDAPPRYQSST